VKYMILILTPSRTRSGTDMTAAGLPTQDHYRGTDPATGRAILERRCPSAWTGSADGATIALAGNAEMAAAISAFCNHHDSMDRQLA
jgi:hypothetical protein